MSVRQIIFTGDSPDTPLRWVRADGAQVLSTGISNSLADYAQEDSQEEAGDVVVILPGERFAARQIATPAKTRQQILQSARFLLEDDLAGAVDELHLALKTIGDGDQKSVIAVEEAYLTDWVAAFKAHGIAPDVLSADFLCLASVAEAVDPVVLLENKRLLYFNNGNGFVSERSFSEDIVGSILEEHTDQAAQIYVLEGEAPLTTKQDDLAQHPLKTKADLVDFYVSAIARGLPTNLLQGKLTPSMDWRATLGHWRTAAMLAAACFVLFLGFQITEGVRLNGTAKQIEQAAEDRFRQTFPDVTVRNLRAKARQLARGGGGDGNSYFLDLSAVLTATLEEGGAIQLLSITYEPSGQLVAEVKGATFGDIDRLEERLTEKGITVSQGRNATQDDSGYTAKVFLGVGV